MSRTKVFFRNSIMMILTSLTIRAVGVIFNIYVTNRVGAETVGLYSLLSGTYAFAVTVATSGIGLAITRTVSEYLASDNVRGAKKALRAGLIYCLCFSGAACLLLFCFAEPIGVRMIGDVRTVKSLRILALTLPCISVSTCLNGYFTAVKRISRNAAAQILSQLVKITATVFLLSLFIPKGMEYACMALVLGGALAELLSLVLTLILFYADSKVTFAKNGTDPEKTDSGKYLIGIALPVALSAYLRSGLITIEHILIPKGLSQSGATWQAALSSFGIIHSVVLPVILFPSAFISSFSGLLVPEISESRIVADYSRIRRVASRIFSFAMIFAVGTAGVMICYSQELGALVSNPQTSDEVIKYIALLAPLIPIMYIDSSVDAVLKGMGQQLYSMIVNVIDAATSVILVMILTPAMGLYGYILTVYITETLNTALSISKMIAVTGFKPKLFHQIFGPILCIICASGISRLLFGLISLDALPPVAGFSVHALSTVVLYTALMLPTGIIGKEEKEVLHVIRSGK